MIDAIVYTSNTGHTEKYAKMLGEKTALPVFSLRDTGNLPRNSRILYLGWLMAGTVKGLAKAQKHFSVTAVIGVGMAPSGTQIDDIRRTNRLTESLPVFTLQGGFEMERLHGIYKFMMKTMLATVGRNLQRKQNRTPDEDEMLRLFFENADKVTPDALEPILHWLSEQDGERGSVT